MYAKVETWEHDLPGFATLLSDKSAWAHSGLAVSTSGEMFAFHGGLLFALDLTVGTVRQMDVGLVEGHGITLTAGHRGQQEIWIADTGRTARTTASEADEGLEVLHGPPRVVRFSLLGKQLLELPLPGIGAANYSPTSVAVAEIPSGGDGTIWVADGYGNSLVHRYDQSGNYVSSLSGEEGAGRFSTPHALFMDYRSGYPTLLVADRGNRRILAYDNDGKFRGAIDCHHLTSPSGFALWQGDYLVVAELEAKLAVFDRDLRLVDVIGFNAGVLDQEGWPNELEGGRPVRRSDSRDRKFVSPHAIATHGKTLIVSEWMIGGRYTALSP